MKPNKFYIHTLGCKVNQAESDIIISLLLGAGWRMVELDKSPDWCIINTCTVTSQSDKKVRQVIHKARRVNPGAKLAVSGCYAELNQDKLEQMGADLVLKNKDKLNIVNHILNKKGEADCSQVDNPGLHTRPLVKIQDGCRQFCSYCIVPVVRGSYHSQPPEQVIGYIKKLVSLGYQEVVLTGIHIGRYGLDFNNNYGLSALLEDILNSTSVGRVRISSIEIGEIDSGLVSLMAENGGRVCRHLHIPLQSGSDRILGLMNRPYSSGYFLKRLAWIRKAVPEVAVSTDVMVGFPGETREDFQNPLEAVKAAGFSKLHVFKYSKRAKTLAASMPDQILPPEKKLRSRQGI
ncbi:MAG: MiaB/RimO family radical SAM methylthiotransferase, partial [Actinomycetia bacterium]|nr:MiaB/RimO family radical SAM methylthiotransferase [Actinomycetes bacterium]